MAHLEEGRRHTVLLEDGDHFVGVARMRAVVEGQGKGLGRQLIAKNLALVIVLWQLIRRVGGNNAIFLRADTVASFASLS